MTSTYKPNWLFKNPHVNTIWSNKLRKVVLLEYQRKRLTTPDGDFIDIDTILQENSTAVILIHGLEGNSDSNYIKRLASTLLQNGFDIFSVNLRGCSGEPNLVRGYYNSGRTEDLLLVIQHLENQYNYNAINIAGFSLGGNLTLKYLGETGNTSINRAVAISVPCDLKSSSLQLEKGFNKIYNYRFVRSLQEKILPKVEQFPDFGLTHQQLKSVKTLYEFDDLYTGPYHNYKNADDYYQKCSSKQFIQDIQTPTLLINALDDPFLPPQCYPFDEAKQNPNFYLEVPKYGGHVGFMTSFNDTVLWHEQRILDFFETN
ncbi:MAG: alpha/beta hydrolase [Bacteroidetes bacterium]|nr:MAG: alpha/beta hydrolase [Bacteroidota bacterium]